MITRRSLLASAVVGVVSGCATLATTRLQPVNGRLRLVVSEFVGLNRPDGFLKVQPVGSAQILYVLADGEGGYVAVSPICKHRGCTVDVAGERLECPCHGSQYARDGSVLRGPTQEPLDRYATTLSPEGVLTISLDGPRP